MPRKNRRHQEKTVEASQQPNDILEQIAADAKAPEDAAPAEPSQAENEAQTSNREAAALEERLTAERVAQARMMNEQAEASVEVKPAAQEETMMSLAAKGREALLHRMRQHEELTRNKPAYVPPPLTERQRSKLEEEMEAGRRAVQRHADQLAHRPPRVADPVKEGFSTPVHRPGLAVPDPKKPDVGMNQTNNKGVYSPNA